MLEHDLSVISLDRPERRPERRPGDLPVDEGVELRDTPGRGTGVFATKCVPAGEIVMVGVIERVLDRNDRHASQIGENLFVLHAGLIRWVNHSCDPNCGIHVNASGAHDFVAMRDIAAGEEVVFDYAMRNHRIEHFPARCLCGAQNCRGRITGWVDLPEHRKADYKGFVAPYLVAASPSQRTSVVSGVTE